MPNSVPDLEMLLPNSNILLLREEEMRVLSQQSDHVERQHCSSKSRAVPLALAPPWKTKVLRFKLSNHCSIPITIGFVPWPVGFLTFTGAVSCTSASTTIHCVAALDNSTLKTALWVVAHAQLGNMFHLFVLFIQAGAGNAMAVEFDKCVQVGLIRFMYFWPFV